ncbi:unnamed protein product [Diatraea saccharalis]|uniref:Uncharacterized protein n=1 Tax=Diatraea saccharalis TaxID=40085 RepID=A0A9N9W962_9NEOP|nr:unnamed protein product [Diatraea saccharalis]
MRKKLVPEEKPVYNAVAVYRERGNYLQRLELFENAILAYNEALRWNGSDVRSLLGRSLARAKATHYVGALADAAKAAELEPENISALQIRAQTEYQKRAFERALVLAHRGQSLRKLPPNFAECARVAEETIRECTGKYAGKMLSNTLAIRQVKIRAELDDTDVPLVKKRVSRMQKQPTQKVVLRERRPLYAARASEAAARARLFRTRKEQLTRAQRQHAVDARRLIHATQAAYEERDTAKCLENAEFAIERISRKSVRLLPSKEKQRLRIMERALAMSCVNICLEGEVADAEESLAKREKAMLSLMQDSDMRSAAEHLFRRMSVIPASRRFSIMPGARVEDNADTARSRRVSIAPKTQQPTRIARKPQKVLGFQNFDY